jgi:hypothetical protein
MFTSAPNPYNSPALLYTPALPSGILGIPTTLPAQQKGPITNPNQPRHHGNTLFFLAGGEFRVWTYDMFQASPGVSYRNVASKAGGVAVERAAAVLMWHTKRRRRLAPTVTWHVVGLWMRDEVGGGGQRGV